MKRYPKYITPHDKETIRKAQAKREQEIYAALLDRREIKLTQNDPRYHNIDEYIREIEEKSRFKMKDQYPESLSREITRRNQRHGVIMNYFKAVAD